MHDFKAHNSRYPINDVYLFIARCLLFYLVAPLSSCLAHRDKIAFQHFMLKTEKGILECFCGMDETSGNSGMITRSTLHRNEKSRCQHNEYMVW